MAAEHVKLGAVPGGVRRIIKHKPFDFRRYSPLVVRPELVGRPSQAYDERRAKLADSR